MLRKDLDRDLLASNPRASLASWQRFRPHILEAIKVHPSRFVIEPTTIRPSTYESRVRDAIRGAIAFEYDVAPFTTETLKDWYRVVYIRHNATQVIISGKTSTDCVIAGIPVQISVVHATTKMSIIERDALVTLVGSGRLASGVTLDTVWPGWVPSHPNVIAQVVDGKTILI